MARRNPAWNMHGKGVTKKEDRWFSKAIRQRDKWRCRVPGCSKSADFGDQMDCCHIEKRVHHATRWDPSNAITMCREHHGHYEARPTQFTLMLMDIGYSREDLEALARKAKSIMKAPDSIRQSISDHYRKQFNRMVQSDSHDLVPWGEAHEDDEIPLRRTDSRAG